MNARSMFYEKINRSGEMKCDFQLVLAGMTPAHIEYQDKALDQILAETGGWKVKVAGRARDAEADR
jgi:hypothetical protein